jgi:hypothetical protein
LLDLGLLVSDGSDLLSEVLFLGGEQVAVPAGALANTEPGPVQLAATCGMQAPAASNHVC